MDRLSLEGATDSICGNAKVLIVDDVEDNREILRRRMTRIGYDVTTVNDGASALQHIEAYDYNLVLLDWMMPGMSGIETLKRIRLNRTPSDLPVIITTARTANDDVIEALTAGANDYITKPFDASVALARIQVQEAKQWAMRQLREANILLRKTNRQLVLEIEERRKAEEKALFMANHDAMTGLANRKKFFGELEHHPADLTTVKDIYFLDLDGFKLINDRHGHDVGDEVLKIVARRLESALEAGGCVARLGGDEFVVLRVLQKAPAAARFADAIRAAIDKPMKIGDRVHAVGVSIGHARHKGGTLSVDEIMRKADADMYDDKAKRKKGRGAPSADAASATVTKKPWSMLPRVS